MKRVWALAILTFTEGIRDRALYGIALIALMLLAANILFTNLFGHELGKVMTDLNLSTIAFAGLLITFFVNINLIAKDIDKRTIYCVLSKPISRAEYIVGKYLGLILLVATALTALTFFSSGSAWFVKASVNEYYFRNFSWLCYYQAFFYSLMMFFLLNAVVIFFSSITSSSFLTFLFSVATYIVGQSVEEVMIFFRSEAAETGTSLNRFFIETLQYFFPNLAAFDIKTLASHGKLLSSDHTVMLLGYSLIYSAILIFLACHIFRRREFN